jgi:hypothetical protein
VEVRVEIGLQFVVNISTTIRLGMLGPGGHVNICSMQQQQSLAELALIIMIVRLCPTCRVAGPLSLFPIYWSDQDLLSGWASLQRLKGISLRVSRIYIHYGIAH